jgi:hypothetical protein
LIAEQAAAEKEKAPTPVKASALKNQFWYSQPELGLLLFWNPDRPEGRDVSHLVIWSDREHRITEKQPN